MLLVNMCVLINMYHDYDLSELYHVACCVLHLISSPIVQPFTCMHSRSQCWLSSIIINLIYASAVKAEVQRQNQQQEKRIQTKENRQEEERRQLEMEEVESRTQIQNQRKAGEAR